MEIRVYLDNNATTRPHREVLEVVRKYEDALYLNASSIAGELMGAAQPLADARAALADLLGASEDDRIILTSGATEANAWAFFATPPTGHIVTSAVEHSSIQTAAERARHLGHPVTVLNVDRDGVLRSDALAAALRPDTRLVSLQLANNETGVIQPLTELARTVRDRAPQALIHTDATQAMGRVSIDLSNDLVEIDALSFSAHKFHGPMGIGGMFLRDGIDLPPLIPGEQQGGRRGGTANVPAAAGMAVAARRAQRDLAAMPRVAALRDRLEAGLAELSVPVRVNGADSRRLPNTSSVVLAGFDADDIVEQLALQGICVAAGSACHAGAATSSPVLRAMGLPDIDARATLRFSLSINSSDRDIDALLSALRALPALSAKRPPAAALAR